MAAVGWWEAFAFVWVIGFLNLTYAAGVALGLHPAAFLLEAFLFGGISLLVIAKPGADAHTILVAPQTWAYGAATILAEIFYYLMIVFVPAADASLFMRANTLITILLGWLMGRRITSLRALGMAITLVGLLVTSYFLPATHDAAFLAVTLVAAVVMSMRNLFAEFHPWNRRARTVIEKMRVTGLVVLATSIVGIVVTVPLSVLMHNGVLPPLAAVPPARQFIALPTIALALTMGCVVITTMQYLMFSSVVKITSENFFAVSSLAPLTTLVLQEAVVRIGLVGAAPAGWGILPFMLLILAGSLLIAWRGGTARGEALLAEIPIAKPREPTRL